jgi:membrane fusion protein (multidrug efflux system)
MNLLVGMACYCPYLCSLLNIVKQFTDVMKLTPLLFLVLLYSCGAGPAKVAEAPAPAEVVTIATANTTTQKDYTAAIQGRTNVEIRPQVEGYLEKIYVDEGAFVKAGQPLFKINDRPFREQMNSATASLHAAQAAMANAQIEVDKYTPLVQNKVVSEVQLKAAQAAYNMARANAEQAKALVEAARINLGYTTIAAPVSGYIGRLPKKQGALVSRTDPEALTLLSDVHEVYAYFSLSENEFIDFKAAYPGATLEEKLHNLPPVNLLLADNSAYSEPGKIDMIDGQFDANTGAITLRAVFPNGKGLIRSGNTGKVRLSREHNSAVVVPQSATVTVQDKIFVFTVAADNKVVKQPITVSGKSGTGYLVAEGVKPGDRIVYNGLDHLQDGAIVQPQPVKADKKLTVQN